MGLQLYPWPGVCGKRMRAKVNPLTPKRKRKTESAVERVAHACDALRAGKPVLVTGDAALAVYAVETAPEDVAAKAKGARLLLTHARARTLKIRLYTQDVAALAIAPGTRLEALRAIADPTADLDFPLKGPFETVREALPGTAAAAVKQVQARGPVARRHRAQGPRLGRGDDRGRRHPRLRRRDRAYTEDRGARAPAAGGCQERRDGRIPLRRRRGPSITRL